MKIIFLGTPEFAIPSLQKILESKHHVKAVVTVPDKERGRGRQVTFSPVKEFALKNKIEVYNPDSLTDTKFISTLKELKPDLFVVVAFRILPKEVYSIPIKGSFNLHGSILPKYRGAAPIQWALINGDKKTGVTTFFLEDKVDTGNIILQEELPIINEDNFGSVHDKMMILGADVVMRTINLIETGSYSLTKQNDLFASSAPKITKEFCEIKWNKKAVEIHNLVRGLSPNPGAYFNYNGQSYKVFKTKVIENDQWSEANSQSSIKSKDKIYQTKKEIFVQAEDCVLQILELQPEGRKRMTSEEFLRGYSLIN